MEQYDEQITEMRRIVRELVKSVASLFAGMLIRISRSSRKWCFREIFELRDISKLLNRKGTECFERSSGNGTDIGSGERVAPLRLFSPV